MKQAILVSASAVVIMVGLVVGLPGAHSAQSINSTKFNIDGSHAAIYFRITHLGMSYTYGRFNEVSGSVLIGIGTTSFDLAAVTASVDTNNEKRDKHLRNADFFNAKQFPSIIFKGTGSQSDGDVLHVTGELQLHGITRSIPIHLKKMGEGEDPWGNYRIGYATEFTIKRSDYEMDSMLGTIGDEVDIMVSFEGIRE